VRCTGVLMRSKWRPANGGVKLNQSKAKSMGRCRMLRACLVTSPCWRRHGDAACAAQANFDPSGRRTYRVAVPSGDQADCACSARRPEMTGVELQLTEPIIAGARSVAEEAMCRRAPGKLRISGLFRGAGRGRPRRGKRKTSIDRVRRRLPQFRIEKRRRRR